MNETLTNTLCAVGQLYDRLLNLKEVNHYDEVRLMAIKIRIEETNKMIDDFGQPLFKRIKENETA